MILQTERLTKAFGGVMAVAEVSLGVQQGDIHGLIGPNGAGKTTFFNLMTRYVTPDHGRTIFDRDDITRWPAHAICQRGLVRCFQRANIYPTLTVAESVSMAVLARNGKAMHMWYRAEGMFHDEVAQILDQVGLTEQASVPGNSLSHGDKKRLELAIALGNGPRLLLLDEPTAGMSREETRSTMQLLQGLRDTLNLTILFTEHDMSVVFGIARRITVLHQGRVIADDTPENVRNNDEVQRVYLGMAT